MIRASESEFREADLQLLSKLRALDDEYGWVSVLTVLWRGIISRYTSGTRYARFIVQEEGEHPDTTYAASAPWKIYKEPEEDSAPDHDYSMVHDMTTTGSKSCPPNCPYLKWYNRVTRQETT
jgi:hypothetical protein